MLEPDVYVCLLKRVCSRDLMLATSNDATHTYPRDGRKHVAGRYSMKKKIFSYVYTLHRHVYTMDDVFSGVLP